MPRRQAGTRGAARERQIAEQSYVKAHSPSSHASFTDL
jgi:hypothetical protein